MLHRSADVRQHDTHRELVAPTGPRNATLVDRGLDAIIVPASRRAASLDQAVTLARAARCWLLVLCSLDAEPADVERLIAERSFHRAIVIRLPDRYRHALLNFSTSKLGPEDLPEACAAYRTDLSTKRNIGLLMAHMLGWKRIFFLDDDIRDINYPDLQRTVSMLGNYSAVGMQVVSYPDNSVVCHAHRMSGEDQDVFVSGAALSVDLQNTIGFFPDIYNEDWLFFYDAAVRGRLAFSGRIVTQLVYSPFADPQRAAWQEFGDVLAEGLYGLLHQGKGLAYATREYWSHFLRARQRFLEAIIDRSGMASAEIREDMVLSVKSALACSVTIRPEQCERYVRRWQSDLRSWQQTVDEIPRGLSLQAALDELELPFPECSRPYGSRAVPDQPVRDDMTDMVPAGRAPIPSSATIEGFWNGGRHSALLPVRTADITVPMPKIQIEPERRRPEDGRRLRSAIARRYR
jgi:hypothetical protein